jgi:hypothetical protein
VEWEDDAAGARVDGGVVFDFDLVQGRCPFMRRRPPCPSFRSAASRMAGSWFDHDHHDRNLVCTTG